MSESITIESANRWLTQDTLYLDLRKRHDGITAKLTSAEHKVYMLPVLMSPAELDEFIASKIAFWLKNNIKIVLGKELIEYSDLSKTRKQFTKRMLRNSVIVKTHSDL